MMNNIPYEHSKGLTFHNTRKSLTTYAKRSKTSGRRDEKTIKEAATRREKKKKPSKNRGCRYRGQTSRKVDDSLVCVCLLMF